MTYYLSTREILANKFTEVFHAETEQECEQWLDHAKILFQFMKEQILSHNAEKDSTVYSREFLGNMANCGTPIAWDDGECIRYVMSLEFKILPYRFVGPYDTYGHTLVFTLNE